MAPRPNASFGQTPWTVPYSTHSSSGCARTSGCPHSPRRCRRARASPSPRFPLVLAAVHEELERGLVRALPGRRRRARCRGGRGLVRRRRPGRAASRRAACAGAPGSSRRRISSASGRARSTCSRRAGSSARRRSRSPSGCRRPPRGRRRCVFAPATSRGSSRSPRTSPRRGTSASSASRNAGSSPSAAGWSTSSRPPAASRCASSSSATRSSRSAPSRRSRSARCARSRRRPSIRPPSGATSSSR